MENGFRFDFGKTAPDLVAELHEKGKFVPPVAGWKQNSGFCISDVLYYVIITFAWEGF